jgi:hypothetical protein
LPWSKQCDDTESNDRNQSTIHFLSPPNVRILAPPSNSVIIKSA